MPLLVLALEWRIAARRRRLMAFNVAIPLLLTGALTLGQAPPHHAAAVTAVLFALFGTFGSAIPLLRESEAGLVARLRHTALAPRAILLQRTMAGALLDTAQLAPALALLALAGARAALLPALAVLAASLLLANAIGAWLAALARAVAEGALFSAVVTLLLLHASGVFRTPSAGSWGARVENIAPFRALHESLLALAGAGPAPGSAAIVALLAAVLVVATATATLAPPLLNMLGSRERR
jgi:hypothetical protein